ncbi:ABC transporter ATP-binding protein [Streptomyces sp. SL13]|uniref:ABC transporter ATP-binding protein n=1 Tax=Streptantibioticus silvisoli TaxID=2705255 RepID=A0AA90H4R9_9ACTN|nr:ABC transporter ATP-binding protein [Streptantibioticus silvisoli]MDI5970382.1 ABC transporter ATP-binding protein [Streptantibioticus silvisoli]
MTTARQRPATAPAPTGTAAALTIRDLRVAFDDVPAVRGVDLTLRRGEVLGLVGESGSGKSSVALAALGLLPGYARVGGSVVLGATPGGDAAVELIGAGDATLSRVRGDRVAMVFQDPLSAFTPVYRIGDQIAEAVRAHRDVTRDAARERAVELLDLVGIPEPRSRAASFPHEFSGGMRQRAMIAMAIANDPDVIVADEPTTALDVTIQAQVLDVLRTARRETGAALLLVSHDLGVIAGTADRVAVMYAGRIVENAPVDDLFTGPRMPYTLALIGAVPRLDGEETAAGGEVDGGAVAEGAVAGGAVADAEMAGGAVAGGEVAGGAVADAEAAGGALTGGAVAGGAVAGGEKADDRIIAPAAPPASTSPASTSSASTSPASTSPAPTSRRRALVPIPGSPPSPGALPPGCPFGPRCPLVRDACRAAEPPLTQVAPEHAAACVAAGELVGAAPADVFPVPDLPPTAPAGRRADRDPVLRVDGLVKTFPLMKGAAFKRRVGSVHAVDGVDLDIRRGETLALVGESGSGKSTALFEIMGMAAPEGGTVELLGTSVAALTKRQVKQVRGRVQIVFQDPMASLDPRMTVGDIIGEPLRAQGADRAATARRVPELLRQVGLEAAHAERFPHEFSGGQRQRIGIARALSVEPDLLVLDEPVSALDVSVQAGVLNLLQGLKARLGLAYLFVSHDLSVVRNIADRVSVVYLGRTVEAGEVAEVFERPRHPYTQALLSAVPLPDPAAERRRTPVLLTGDPPSPTVRHTGCRFRGRCPVYAVLDGGERQVCETEAPALRPHAEDHVAACHFPRARDVIAG